MKKTENNVLFSNEKRTKLLNLKMKLSLILTLLFVCQLSAGAIFSQDKINLNYNNVILKTVLNDIKLQSGYKFFYNINEINDAKKVSISIDKEGLQEVLRKLSIIAEFNYTINKKQIVLTKRNVQKEIKVGVLEDRTIKGTVKDSDGELLIGATVIVKNSKKGTQVDIDGNFTLSVPDGTQTLVISYLGYKTQEVEINGETFIEIILKEDAAKLETIVIVGSRNKNRTSTQSSVPIDIIDISEVVSKSGPVSVNEILNFVAPSFTSQTQTVSDGTDHLDPASLRGLGPDQVLVLINGKRRHTSALINVNGTVGAGSVGTDMNAIPSAAIQRIEVLRDGAAAQYGSDAIAGVINIVLKRSTGLDFSITTGANSSKNSNHFEGGSDGEKFQIDVNYGLPIGENGFINLTGSLSTRLPALRNKDYAGDIYKGYHAAERVFAASGGNVATMTLADYQSAASGISYLDPAVASQIAALDVSTPTGIDNIRNLLSFNADEDELTARELTRKDFRFKVGTSKLREGKFFANLSLPLNENTQIYGFGGISFRQGLASGFYRRPAQGDGRANTPAFPNGFLPNIGSDILDQSIAFGVKGESNGWDLDFSNTYGKNTFGLTVGNSSNGTLGVSTQRSFDAGALSFSQNTTNFDVSKFHEDIFEGLNIAFGAEYKLEQFQIEAGEEASYLSYDINGSIVTGVTPDNLLVRNNFTGAVLGGGAQVFRGYDPGNAIKKARSNFSLYTDFEADFTENFLVSLAGRYENYSDFGSTFNYKLATRIKLSDHVSLRAASSSGFRAPSLHQQYFSRTSTVFVDNAPFEQGTFTNDSRAADLIGIAKLKEENSNSFSGGLTAKFGKLSVTVDGYQINIDDRIVYSGSFGNGGDPELTTIFNSAGATSARFFVNAIDTKSTGMEIVLSHKTKLGENTILKNSFAASFNKTVVENVVVPEKIKNAGLSGAFFDGQEEAFLTLAQPRKKLNLTQTLSINSWDFTLRNVYFGEVTDPDDFNGDARVAGTVVSDDAVYAGKLITDFTISKKLGENLNLSVGANNLFDVYPDENRAGGTSGDQFVYSRRTSQFGYSGRFVFTSLKLSL